MKILWIVLFLLSLPLHAATNSEDVIMEKARARAYDGGVDEQPITVQARLNEPKTDGTEQSILKKYQTTIEAPPEEEPSDETSSGF